MKTANRSNREITGDVRALLHAARLDLDPLARPRSAPIYLREARRALGVALARDPGDREVLSLLAVFDREARH